MAVRDYFGNGHRYRNPVLTNSLLKERYELAWVAGRRGKPGINADIASATESVREIADPDFEILGLNSTSALCTKYAEGGITLTTATGNADSMILAPHLDTSQTNWTDVTWGTDQKTEWECDISTGAAITVATIWAGLKLTNVSTVATDDDQAFFRYAAADGANWTAVSSIAGTDTETDTSVVVTTSTRYHLAITFDSARLARFYINGALVETTAAIDAADLIPYIGVLVVSGGVAKAIHVHGQAISRVIA